MIYDALDRVYERYVYDPKQQWILVVRAKEHLSKAASSAG